MRRRQARVVPDAVEALVDLHPGGVLVRREAEGVTRPFTEEALAVLRPKELAADGRDVGGSGGGPDEDGVVSEAVGEEVGKGGPRQVGGAGVRAVEERTV